MQIVDNIENLIECPCGTAYTFNEKDLRMVNIGTLGVACPKCGQMSFVVTETKLKVIKEPIEIKGEIVDESH